MKKINFGEIVMIVMLAAATWFGATLMDNVWVEEMSGRIWMIGELSIVLVYGINRLIGFMEKHIEEFKK